MNLPIKTKSSQVTNSETLTQSLPLVTTVQWVAPEVFMLLNSYFLHYRLIREAVTVIVTAGTALLFSYLILQV